MPKDSEDILESEALINALHKIEIEYCNLDYEIGVLFSPDGKIIKEWIGKDDEIIIPAEDYKNKNLWQGNIFTHNHPRGLHFSYDDIDLFADMALLEMRVSMPSKTYFSIIKNKDFYLKISNEILKDKVGSFAKGMELAIKQGLTFADRDFAGKLNTLRTEHADEWFKNNADKYKYIYGKGAL